MDPEYDPVVGFARAAETMAQTQRLLAWLQGLAIGMLFISLCGLGWLIWQGAAVQAASDVHTQALLELVRRGQPAAP